MKPEDAVKQYQDINKEISSRIIYLSLAVIASIFVICEKYGVETWRLAALLGFVLTIGIHILSCICASKHYEYYLDAKIKTIHFNESQWGVWAERLNWIFIIAFIISMAIFIIALVSSIDAINGMIEMKALQGV